MEQKLRNLSQYQDYINDILNNEYSNITDEDKQIIQDGFRVAFEKLFTEDEEQERMISVNCSQQFQSIVADKMDIALQYAHTVLQQSTSQFATLVQDIVQYGGDLTSALTQCLSLYESQDNKVVNPLMKGSSSYECKQVEIQILSQFVYEFVVKSSGLLGGRDLDMGAWPSDIPEIFPRPEPVTDEPTIKWAEPLSKEGTEPSNELSTQGAEPSNESSKEGAEPSNKPSNEGAEPSNESSNESSNEGAEPSNESSNEGAEPSNEPSNEGAEPSNEPSNEEPGIIMCTLIIDITLDHTHQITPETKRRVVPMTIVTMATRTLQGTPTIKSLIMTEHTVGTTMTTPTITTVMASHTPTLTIPQ